MTIEATGERFIPEVMGGQLIEAEHVARYAWAAQLVGGLRVLDAGCGVGWGAALLLAAGAAHVAGIDLDADAVADAASRVPSADFVQGDLAALPWDAESFEVVVCFETIEHIAEQDRALDEMVRVLAPDGLLIVSSPNPRVYPAGNPFHVHELTPEELAEAVGKRLPNVVLCHQHNQIASVVVSDQGLPPGETRDALARIVSPLEPGSDPYSVVVASRRRPPTVPPLVCCAPSDQLLHLEALAAAVTSEREAMAEQAERMQAERGELLREREHTAMLLLDSEQRLAETLAAAEAQLYDQHQQLAELGRLYHELEVIRTSKSWRLTAPLRTVMALRAAKR